jgi:hypothetical protein
MKKLKLIAVFLALVSFYTSLARAEPFIPGTYHGMVATVDIAATFASLLRINRPSAAVGRTLTEALRTEGPGATCATDSKDAKDKIVIRPVK